MCLRSQVQRLKSQILGATSLTLSPANLEARHFVDTDHSAWDELPSVQTLLPSILALWHELHVPLLTRSQFLIAHQAKDVFYFMAEQGHLLDLQRCASRQLTVKTRSGDQQACRRGHSTERRPCGGARREVGKDAAFLRRASTDLHHERQWLAMRLKQVYSDEERAELFRLWNITQIKERKKALSLKLWDPAV